VQGENRVALVPEVLGKLNKLGVKVVVQREAGTASCFPDEAYKGDNIDFVESAADVYAAADLIFKIQCPSEEEIAHMKEGQYLIGSLSCEKNIDAVKALASKGVVSWATEYIPRITRAQSMDTLSSQAAISGYFGVLKASTLSSKFFPMLTTAAGTIRPAKVLVLGAGVAGLQAIATAKRLGAIVEAYDIRPETKEQCESLGAKFIDTGIDAAGEGGYARELTDEERKKQQEIVDAHIVKADAVITTAAVPGRPSPKLLSAAVVADMKPGAVIVDLASEGGGNCEETEPGTTKNVGGVIVDGPLNVPSELAVHASEMFSKNLLNFISPFVKEGELEFDWEDEIIKNACVTRDGSVVAERLKALVGGAQ
jgi:NAD(P) transhydrogenase subunit alpha